MIVCLCKNISSKNISNMVQKGMSKREIVETTNIGKQCGSCKSCFNCLFKKEKHNKEIIKNDF